MTIVVGFSNKREGWAALEHAVNEARLRSLPVILVPNTEREDVIAGRDEVEKAGVEVIVEKPSDTGRIADHIIEVAERNGAEVLVIGLRRRSPTGKLLLGLNAQRILLDATCPVHAVKAD
ncbi:MAG TPA: universal stress protein [Propionibacterium sp.]|jgi:nucleotide-binding universal stress UspA family protein|nr:universal stress protein [Propionibacterium sp.]